VLKNLRAQYVEIKIQDNSAARKLIEGKAQTFDGKPNVSANTVHLLVTMYDYLAQKPRALKSSHGHQVTGMYIML
jgi:hypothetical protein